MKCTTPYNKGYKLTSNRESVMLKKESLQLGINKREIRNFLQKSDAKKFE